VQKEALCEKTRYGEIRVLLGSTGKLGTGTNVQRLLVASHDLDVPWRPSDLEQRLGRTVRQGNLNDQVELFRYTTVDSFDLFMYETNDRKSGMVDESLRDPKNANRTYDEETEINFNDIVAITTGYPHVKEKVEVDAAVVKLGRAEAAFYAKVTDAAYDLKYAQKNLISLQSKYSHIKENIETLNNHIKRTKQKDFALTIDGPIVGVQDASTTYTDKTVAAKVMMVAINQINLRGEESVRFGEMYGLPVNVVLSRDQFSDTARTKIGLGNNQFTVSGTGAPHTIYRQLRENLSTGMLMEFKACEERINQTETLIVNSKQYDENAVFPDAKDLAQARDRQKVLDIDLIKFSKEIQTPDTFIQDLKDYIATLPEEQQAMKGYAGLSRFTPELEESDRVVANVNIEDINKVLDESLASTEMMH